MRLFLLSLLCLLLETETAGYHFSKLQPFTYLKTVIMSFFSLSPPRPTNRFLSSTYFTWYIVLTVLRDAKEIGLKIPALRALNKAVPAPFTFAYRHAFQLFICIDLLWSLCKFPLSLVIGGDQKCAQYSIFKWLHRVGSHKALRTLLLLLFYCFKSSPHHSRFWLSSEVVFSSQGAGLSINHPALY